MKKKRKKKLKGWDIVYLSVWEQYIPVFYGMTKKEVFRILDNRRHFMKKSADLFKEALDGDHDFWETGADGGVVILPENRIVAIFPLPERTALFSFTILHESVHIASALERAKFPDEEEALAYTVVAICRELYKTILG